MQTRKARQERRAAAMAAPQPARPLTGIVSITMVKNEQDIIEPFLRHNRQFVDAMIILDNGSVDDTRRIIEDCGRELGGIIWTDLPEFRYQQSEVITAALHFVQGAFFADYICFLDADEFIGATDRAAFLDHLEKLQPGEAGMIGWQTFLPDPDLPGEGDTLARMVWRRKKERPGYDKAILRAGGGLDHRLVVTQGSHAITAVDRGAPKAVPLAALALKHFPVRTSEQQLAKGIVGWMANIARNPHSASDGSAYQWQALYQDAISGRSPATPAELANTAMGYAQKSRPANWHDNAVRADHAIDLCRRHSDGNPGDPVRVIARSWEKSILNPSYPLPALRGGVDEAATIENAFTTEWHRANLFLDAAPIRYLVEKFRPQSAFDVGCGHGIYLDLLKWLGVGTVFGVDGIPGHATVLADSDYRQVDLQLPFSAGRSFELVMCLEVIEHLRPDMTATAFDTITSHARDLILFSVAEPGQPGNGHINCMTQAQALAEFAARGWYPDLIDSLGVRALSTLSWFRRNLIVLHKGERPESARATEVLCDIGGYRYRWYGQSPGARLAVLSEPYPAHPDGYGLQIPETETGQDGAPKPIR